MEFCFDAFHGAQRILAVAESREAEVALAAGTEACAWRADDIDFCEQLVEEVPRRHIIRGLEPDVRSIDAAIGFDAGRLKSFADDAGIFHVVADELFDLLLALRRIDSSSAALDDVGRAIELRRMAAVPELVELNKRAVSSAALDRLGDDRIAAARAGEAGRL